MKNYLATPKPVSGFTEAKLEAYISAGNTIKDCSHGESGGMPTMYKEMISKAAKKSNNKRSKKNGSSK